MADLKRSRSFEIVDSEDTKRERTNSYIVPEDSVAKGDQNVTNAACSGVWCVPGEQDFYIRFNNRKQMIAGLEFWFTCEYFLRDEPGRPKNLKHNVQLFKLSSGEVITENAMEAEFYGCEWRNTFLRPGLNGSNVDEDEYPSNEPCIVVEYCPGFRYVACCDPDVVDGIKTMYYVGTGGQIPTITWFRNKSEIP